MMSVLDLYRAGPVQEPAAAWAHSLAEELIKIGLFEFGVICSLAEVLRADLVGQLVTTVPANFLRREVHIRLRAAQHAS
jgi:hypothetical protein